VEFVHIWDIYISSLWTIAYLRKNIYIHGGGCISKKDVDIISNP
jgi:hypothetical protein